MFTKRICLFTTPPSPRSQYTWLASLGYPVQAQKMQLSSCSTNDATLLWQSICTWLLAAHECQYAKQRLTAISARAVSMPTSFFTSFAGGSHHPSAFILSHALSILAVRAS